LRGALRRRGEAVVLVLSKADLVEEAALRAWEGHLRRICPHAAAVLRFSAVGRAMDVSRARAGAGSRRRWLHAHLTSEELVDT